MENGIALILDVYSEMLNWFSNFLLINTAISELANNYYAIRMKQYFFLSGKYKRTSAVNLVIPRFIQKLYLITTLLFL
jgi:hypothetical protein